MRRTTPKPPLHDLIARKLRAFYDKVAEEPLPDRFKALLDDLDAKTPRRKAGRGTNAVLRR